MWGAHMSIFFWAPRKKWVVQWSDSGVKKRRYFSSEQEANSFENERITPEEEQALTFGELVALYFRSNPNTHYSTKSKIVNFLAGREDGKKHIEGCGEFLRDKFAEKLTRRDLEVMREAVRATGSGNNTINKYQAYIRAILAWGVDQQLILLNPWRDYKRLPVKRHIVSTNLMHIRMVYECAPEWLQWAMKTMYACSLRAGQTELFSLAWSSFDFRRGMVTVRQGKSGHIKRVFPPVQYMQEAEKRYNEDMSAGIPLVCHRSGGRQVLSYSKAWAQAIKDAGLQHFPMHHIRHAAASEMIGAGADLASVSAQLGHSSVSTTGNTYAHVTAGGQQRAAALMPSIEPKK